MRYLYEIYGRINKWKEEYTKWIWENGGNDVTHECLILSSQNML